MWVLQLTSLFNFSILKPFLAVHTRGFLYIFNETHNSFLTHINIFKPKFLINLTQKTNTQILIRGHSN